MKHSCGGHWVWKSPPFTWLTRLALNCFRSTVPALKLAWAVTWWAPHGIIQSHEIKQWNNPRASASKQDVISQPPSFLLISRQTLTAMCLQCQRVVHHSLRSPAHASYTTAELNAQWWQVGDVPWWLPCHLFTEMTFTPTRAKGIACVQVLVLPYTTQNDCKRGARRTQSLFYRDLSVRGKVTFHTPYLKSL